MTREKFDLKYYKQGKQKVAVQCDTEEKAKAFIALAKSVGYDWNVTRDGIETTLWDVYGSDTGYIIAINCSLLVGSISEFYLKNNYTIVKFELDEPNGYVIEDTPSPMKEMFNINDIVYSMPHKKYGRIVQINYIVEIDGKEETVIQAVVCKQKPLKEITGKELADMGFVIKK